MHYSTTWVWIAKLTTLIREKLGCSPQTEVHCSELRKVLFRRSSEPYMSNMEPENNIETNADEMRLSLAAHEKTNMQDTNTSQSTEITDIPLHAPETEGSELGSKSESMAQSRKDISALVFKKRVSTTFHGISRKYVQNYGALLGFIRSQENNKFEKLVGAAVDFGNITRKQLLEYISPNVVKIPVFAPADLASISIIDTSSTNKN